MMWPYKSRGFTLIELLVVMVLIGIFSSLVFVSVSSGIFRSREKRFVQSFTQSLFRARAASLGRGRVVRFLINGEKREFCIEGRRCQDIPKSIQIEGKGIGKLEPNVYAVTFYPDGSSSGGEIDLKKEDGSTDQIEIDKILGLIHIEHTSS